MPLKVLSIDDDAVDRQIIKRALSKREDQDLVIHEAETGADAKAKLEDNVYDCIFLDYMLPDMNGLEFLKSIYDEETEMCAVPVIMLTGEGNQAVMLEAIEYGVQDYQVKNQITPETLYIALQKAISFHTLKKTHLRTRQQLSQSQKMEAIGQLTGGIAHDFNNLLTIVFGNIRLIEFAMQKGDVEQEFLLEKIAGIKRSAQRGADLVKHLMVFARQRKMVPELLDINEMVMETENLLSKTLGPNIEIDLQLSTQIGLIKADASQLENAVINMAINAKDSMPKGGKLRIATSVQDHKKLGENAICLSISDTGVGMSEDVQARIFEPFYTTKSMGEGTGLGLSMVHSFIEETGGHIEVESKQGKGTAFHIYFPHAADEYEQCEEKDEESNFQDWKGSGTILVVEDEIEIREIAVSILKNAGYTVYDAGNAQDAQDLIKKHADSIELVFSDITMPGAMNGIALGRYVHGHHPDIRVLLTTGYFKNASTIEPDLKGEFDVIEKPYNVDTLMEAFQQMLGNG